MCRRPEFPIGCVLPVGAIHRLVDEQKRYDRDPDEYCRQERADQERREEEERAEREAEWQAEQAWREEQERDGYA